MTAPQTARPATVAADGGPETDDGYPVDLERTDSSLASVVQVCDRKPAVDLLAQAIDAVRPTVCRPIALRQRLRALWAGVVAASDLAASDVVEESFIALARQVGLESDLGHHGAKDIQHVVSWGVRGRDPFGKQ